MRTRAERSALLRKAVEDALRAAGPEDSGPPSHRLAKALGKERLDIEAGGVEISAEVTADLGLAVRVHRIRGWDVTVERALHAALERSGALLARLVLAEWSAVRDACEAAARRLSRFGGELQSA